MNDTAHTMAEVRWNPWVRALHWLGVLLVLAVATIGLVMVDLERGTDLRRLFYALHKSLGITALALVAIRVLLRLSVASPLPLRAQHAWLARSSHVAMYLLLFAIPLSGWLLNSVAGQPLPWFGLFELPSLAQKNPEWRHTMDAVHLWSFWILIALVCIHVMAALYHHWWLRDATLVRMLPSRRRPW